MGQLIYVCMRLRKIHELEKGRPSLHYIRTLSHISLVLYSWRNQPLRGPVSCPRGYGVTTHRARIETSLPSNVLDFCLLAKQMVRRIHYVKRKKWKEKVFILGANVVYLTRTRLPAA